MPAPRYGSKCRPKATMGGVPPNPRTFQMRQTGGLMDPNQESVLCQASLQNWITNAWTRATQSHLVPPNAQLYEPIDMNLAGRGTIPETYYVERCDNSNTQRARQFLQFLEQGPQSESGAVQGKPPVPQKQAPPGGELPPQQPAWTSMPRFPSPQKSKWGFKSLGR